jgi:hypothetical protein
MCDMGVNSSVQSQMHPLWFIGWNSASERTHHDGGFLSLRTVGGAEMQ